MIEKYSFNRAREEAQKIEQKIETGAVNSYSDAEIQVEKEENPREKETKKYAIHFNNFYFGEREESMGTAGLVGHLNKWWDSICEDNNRDPKDKILHQVGYYLIELCKNALEYTSYRVGGEVEVMFSVNKVTIIVTDQGSGFEDPNEDMLHNPEHGLITAKNYADEFTIETNGRKFTKVPKKKKLVISLDTDVKKGSRITLVKNFKIN